MLKENILTIFKILKLRYQKSIYLYIYSGIMLGTVLQIECPEITSAY